MTPHGLEDIKFSCEQCGQPYSPDSRAPHKRFCSAKCRLQWHQAQRQLAVTEHRERLKKGNSQ